VNRDAAVASNTHTTLNLNRYAITGLRSVVKVVNPFREDNE